MPRPDFPMTIDSTMRAAFISCPRKYELEFLNNYAHPLKSIHLVAGAAFAKGLEVARSEFWAESRSPSEAWTLGLTALILAYENHEDYEGQPKDLAGMMLAFEDYWNHYGWESDYIKPHFKGNRVCVENSFALPINVLHPQSGEPILYSGRFDMVGEYKENLFVVDDKTTGYLGAQWLKNWPLRAQLTGYCWAAQSFEFPVAGAIIRGCAIKKTGRDFAESIQYRPQWEIDRWLFQLNRDIQRMVDCWTEGYFDYALDGACANYGGCQFLDVCKFPQPQRLLDAEFVQRNWDPLAKT